MTLFEAAAALLQAVEDSWTEVDVLPSRRYVSNGAVAHDCEQATVAILRTYAGTPSALASGPTQGMATRTATLRAEVARCVPSTDEGGPMPSAAGIQDSAEEVHRDHDLLIIAARKFAKESGCEEVIIGDALPFGPEGGIAGWGLEVRAQLG